MTPRTSQPRFTPITLLLVSASVVAVAQQHAAYKKAFVYVSGAVKSPGPHYLREGQTVTVLEALKLSGGLNETAAKGQAKIFRQENGSVSVIEIDLDKVLRGVAPNLELVAGDALFIPDMSRSKQRRVSPYYDPPIRRTGVSTS